MAHALQTFRARLPAEALLRLVHAALRARFAARTHERDTGHQRAGLLDADRVRDIGADRQYQDYAASAHVSASADRRLHSVADAGRWASPR